MRFRAEKDLLVEAGQAVLRLVSPRAASPVLGGVRITASSSGVEFAATDLEAYIAIDRAFGVEEEGVCVVPGRLFADVLKSLPPGQVSIRSSGTEVVVTGGKAEFSISSFPPGDFPHFEQAALGEERKVEGQVLATALKQAVKAAGTDEARPLLTGVFWSFEGENLRLVSTDSYRLAVRELALKEGSAHESAVIPGRVLGELARHLAGEEVSIRLGESQAGFETGSMRLVTRLIEGEFPDYRRLLPEGYNNRLTVPREELQAAVARAAVVVQANTPVKLELGSEVRLTASEPGVGEASETLEGASYSGDDMLIAFNPRFLSDGLDVTEGDNAVLETGDATRPAVLRGEDRQEFTYLVMPVRLSGT